VAQREFAIFTNVGVKTYNVHIVDLLPFIDSVICFCSFGSTPVQGITNIYRRILHIVLLAKFIFKARIFNQQLSKLTPPDRKNFITSVFDFLQPRFSLLIRVLQSFLGLTNWFVSIGHAKTPMPKAPLVLKRFIRLFAFPFNFHVARPSQTKLPPITGMRNITRRTNGRQPLKSLMRLTIPRTIAHYRGNNYRICFHKYCSEHLVWKWTLL